MDPERTADPAIRRATLRRAARLFRPYKLRLSAVLALIVLSAILGVIPAFLLRGARHPGTDVLRVLGDVLGVVVVVLARGHDADRRRFQGQNRQWFVAWSVRAK